MHSSKTEKTIYYSKVIYVFNFAHAKSNFMLFTLYYGALVVYMQCHTILVLYM